MLRESAAVGIQFFQVVVQGNVVPAEPGLGFDARGQPQDEGYVAQAELARAVAFDDQGLLESTDQVAVLRTQVRLDGVR